MRRIFLLTTVVLFSACSTATHKLSPADLLIPIDKPLEKPPVSLSKSQVRADLDYLIYALDRGYAGRNYLPAGAYDKMIKNLEQVSGSMSPDSLRDAIDSVLLDVPDSHLHARLNNKWSKLRDSQEHVGHVGNNFYIGSDEKPWNLEIRKIKKKKVLLISITGFPFHESSGWNGFLDQVRKNLMQVSAAVIDLRGNGGGDDTIGLQMAWIFFGKNYRYPLSTEHERKTAETQALYANMFGYRIAKDLGDGKKTDEFMLKRYRDRKGKFDAAIAEKSDGYSSDDQSVYEYSGKLENIPQPFGKPVFILMDQRCASSCESTIDAFEFYPRAKRIGESTAGFIHFGNVSPAVLPNSKIMVQIGTHFTEYYDKRFIEKIGIKPDVQLSAGTDALDYTLQLIGKEAL